MSSDPTMELLIERAREDYETCSRNLGIATAQRDHQQQKHRMLEEYREEYRNKLEEHASTGMDIAAMINYRRFLTQLDQAVEQQGTLLQQAEAPSSLPATNGRKPTGASSPTKFWKHAGSSHANGSSRARNKTNRTVTHSASR